MAGFRHESAFRVTESNTQRRQDPAVLIFFVSWLSSFLCRSRYLKCGASEAVA
jgi:hypothetical protein